MKEIYLHGSLADKFQPSYDLDVDTPAEAIRALVAMVPGFERHIREGEWRVIRGSTDGGVEQELEQLKMGFGSSKELHIYPALELGKRGVGKILMGIAMIGLVVFAPYVIPALVAAGMPLGVGLGMAASLSHIALFGLSMALTGVSQVLTSTPRSNYSDREKDKPSYLFNGPINLSQQGNCVPLVYGLDVMVGSLVIHSAVSVDDVGAASGGSVGGSGSILTDAVRAVATQHYSYFTGAIN